MNPQPVSLADELRQLPKMEAPLGDDTGVDWVPLEEVLALLAQHAVAEPQISVPMREWLQAKRVELSAEQLWAVESYLVMNVLPIAPAQPKLTKEQATKLALLIVARCSVVATKEQELGASDVGFEVQQVKYEIPILLNSLFAASVAPPPQDPFEALKQSRVKVPTIATESLVPPIDEPPAQERASDEPLRDKIETALWDNAEGKDYRAAPLSIRREFLDVAMPIVNDALATAVKQARERALETMIEAIVAIDMILPEDEKRALEAIEDAVTTLRPLPAPPSGEENSK